MDLILSYYRNPIFGILVLISLIIVVVLASMILASYKENKTNKNIKKYLANFNAYELNYLNNLSEEEKINLANGFYKASLYLECKQVLMNCINAHNRNLLYLLAMSNLRLGLLNDAKELLLQILSKRARDEEALLALAYVYFKLNLMNDCKDVYKSLNVLNDYQKDLDFIMNFDNTNPNYSYKEIKIDEKTINKDNITQFYLCNNCSSHSLFYTPFCSQCFRCNTMQTNIRIKI